MRGKTFSILVGFFGLFLTGQAMAMAAESVRLSVYRKGETILGEEFIAANEGVVDYIATLRRPTDGFKAFRYDCVVKGTGIRPTVQGFGVQQNPRQWVQIVTIYDMHDCVEVP